MITKAEAQALTYRDTLFMFSFKNKVVNVRVSGACKTWKKRPDEFRLPVKYGLYENGAIDQDNCHRFFLSSTAANAYAAAHKES